MLKIIAENQNYLIIHKPAETLVHRAPQTPPEEKTLTDLIAEKFPEIKTVGENHRPGIIHRLDKDVSGVMIIARNQKTYENLINQFKNKQIQKTYTALVFEHTKEKKATINQPIKRSKKDFRKFTTDPSGKSAITKYKALEFYKDTIQKQELTLLEVSPITGRTHQIRVHLKSINHPIVGDLKYCFKPQRKYNPEQKIFLHATSIAFTDPETEEIIQFTDKLPTFFQNHLNTLTCL